MKFLHKVTRKKWYAFNSTVDKMNVICSSRKFEIRLAVGKGKNEGYNSGWLTMVKFARFQDIDAFRKWALLINFEMGLL